MDTMTQEEFDAAQEAEEIQRHKRLRDEFAMAVLPMVYKDASISDDVRDIAAHAYHVADAMIRERDK